MMIKFARNFISKKNATNMMNPSFTFISSPLTKSNKFSSSRLEFSSPFTFSNIQNDSDFESFINQQDEKELQSQWPKPYEGKYLPNEKIIEIQKKFDSIIQSSSLSSSSNVKGRQIIYKQIIEKCEHILEQTNEQSPIKEFDNLTLACALYYLGEMAQINDIINEGKTDAMERSEILLKKSLDIFQSLLSGTNSSSSLENRTYIQSLKYWIFLCHHSLSKIYFLKLQAFKNQIEEEVTRMFKSGEDALEMLKQIFPANSLHLMEYYQIQAQRYHYFDSIENAKKYYNQALRILEQNYGTDMIKHFTILREISDVYFKLGNKKATIEYLYHFRNSIDFDEDDFVKLLRMMTQENDPRKNSTLMDQLDKFTNVKDKKVFTSIPYRFIMNFVHESIKLSPEVKDQLKEDYVKDKMMDDSINKGEINQTDGLHSNEDGHISDDYSSDEDENVGKHNQHDSNNPTHGKNSEDEDLKSSKEINKIKQWMKSYTESMFSDKHIEEIVITDLETQQYEEEVMMKFKNRLKQNIMNSKFVTNFEDLTHSL